MNRCSGIFLHITSLPSKFGIGDMGPDAFRWIDLLNESKQTLWQVCPIGPLGYGYSPYMTLSAFGGNTLLISPEVLVKWGYLKDSDLLDFPKLCNERVLFEKVEEAKETLFKKAFKNFTPTTEYNAFVSDEKIWLDDYVLFLSLSREFKTNDWNKWPEEYRLRDAKALASWSEKHSEELEYYRFLQFIFQSQWFDLKKYANSKGVKLFGDVPYYVSFASSDVWANPELFELDSKGNPIRVGGVPPDYFSEDGQLWGNPLYRWDIMKKDDYSWWKRRIGRSHYYTDFIRIDHFRAFEAYWAVPASSKTAKNGEWVPCPGIDFFESLQRSLGELPLIAEDLGTITQEVVDLRMSYDIPGMKVFQFAFDGNKENWYLPYNCGQNSVMYSGTHDNDTLIGWFDTLDSASQNRVLSYLDIEDSKALSSKVIREVLASVSKISVFPLQDILRLGSESRFNVPGTVDGENWSFRFVWDMVDPEHFSELCRYTEIYGRI